MFVAENVLLHLVISLTVYCYTGSLTEYAGRSYAGVVDKYHIQVVKRMEK